MKYHHNSKTKQLKLVVHEPITSHCSVKRITLLSKLDMKTISEYPIKGRMMSGDVIVLDH